MAASPVGADEVPGRDPSSLVPVDPLDGRAHRLLALREVGDTPSVVDDVARKRLGVAAKACSTYFCETRCGSSAALHDPDSVATRSRASRADGSRNLASSWAVKRVKYAMSVGKSSGSPSRRTSSANPSRR